MSTPAAFSRLQLAAALLEYDNDLDDPDAPYRSAQESAIFAHFRRNPAARPELTSRKSDYLDVSLPSETGSLGGRESVLGTHRSRASRSSMDALRNPFRADDISELEGNEEGEETNLEVDLTSWGLGAFMPKEKHRSSKSKGKQPIPPTGSTRSHQPLTNEGSLLPSPRRGRVTSKSMSVGGIQDHLEEGRLGASQFEDRRRSFATPLDLAGIEPSGVPLVRQRALSQTSLAPSHSVLVPFPSSPLPSPGPEHSYSATMNKADTRLREHSYSITSVNSRLILDEGKENGRDRNISSGSMGMPGAMDNPFAIENPSHTSRFDPKAVATRRYSNASIGSRVMHETMSVMTGDPNLRDRPYSTLELLRPKVLVMPSPLQPVSTKIPIEPSHQVRDGFHLSTDGPPLPPGARASRRLSSSFSTYEIGADPVPLASNSFIPNPLGDLSLSQKTFRNTLVVSGQRTSYIESEVLPKASHDGEQAQFEPPAVQEAPQLLSPEETQGKGSRPAGKLYGKSLIDDLENRKAQMRSKQRVFTGDDRPSMMAREPRRSSTLIDPVSLQARPSPQRLSSKSPQSGLLRQNSSTLKPLLNFDDEDDKALRPSPAGNKMPSSRSVFGVDMLWEREMAKLKEIKAEEERDNERRRIAEDEVERKRITRKDKKKRKGKLPVELKGEHAEQRLSESQLPPEPPTLPDIQRATKKVPPKPSDSDTNSDTDDQGVPLDHKGSSPAWHVGSSDEDEGGPRRTTGVGPRYPRQPVRKIHARMDDDDSEEDLPLSATIHKAVTRASFGGSHLIPQDSDDEDKPLSQILNKKDTTGTHLASSKQFQHQNDSEDDQPLGLRASRMPLMPSQEEEDDTPLAFHPEQQRRTQYQMFAQAQQQQQMMAQFQSNMFVNAPMMAPGYYINPMVNPVNMMQIPMPIPSPPPVHDEVKFGRVDRWRRDVAIDGE